VVTRSAIWAMASIPTQTMSRRPPYLDLRTSPGANGCTRAPSGYLFFWALLMRAARALLMPFRFSAS
jgi:hypothetical protein